MPEPYEKVQGLTKGISPTTNRRETWVKRQVSSKTANREKTEGKIPPHSQTKGPQASKNTTVVYIREQEYEDGSGAAAGLSLAHKKEVQASANYTAKPFKATWQQPCCNAMTGCFFY